MRSERFGFILAFWALFGCTGVIGHTQGASDGGTPQVRPDGGSSGGGTTATGGGTTATGGGTTATGGGTTATGGGTTATGGGTTATGGGGGGTIPGPLSVTPTSAVVSPGAQQAFLAWGGVEPLSWSLATNQSGGSLTVVKDYLPLKEAPTLSGATQWQQWAHAQPVVVMDNHGNHELFTFGSPGSTGGRLHLLKSADLGETWAWITPDTYAQAVASDTIAGVMSVTQDSAGTVHLLYYRAGTVDVVYYRLTLTYSGGAITGYAGLTGPTPIPGLPGGPGTQGDVRGVIRTVATAGGAEVLAVLVTTGGSRLQGSLCITSTLAPASPADFRDLSGNGTAASLVIDDARATPGGSHDHNILFAQLGSSRDLWLFAGNTPAEAGPTAPTTISRVRLTASGETWTQGTATDGTTPSTWLLGVAGTANYVWAMVGQYATGQVRFARVNASGAYEEPVATIPSPVIDSRSSQTMFGTFTVNPDETRIWAIFTRDPGSGGRWYDFTPTGAFWNGATWQVRSDIAHGDSASQGFSDGLGGSVGWETGVVALMTKTVNTSFNGPILLATMRAPPDGAGGGAQVSAESLYTAGPTGNSIDRVTVTDSAGASASVTITVR